MQQATCLRVAILKPCFVSCQEEFEPTARPISMKEIAADTIEKRKKKDRKDQQDELSEKLLAWHGSAWR